nr:MAG TPA_asm: hypothetical protein [Caudoviricetes sp.]
MVNTYIYLYVLIIPIRLCFKKWKKLLQIKRKTLIQCK